MRNQSDWHKYLKARTRANDLAALRLYFAWRINTRWNNELRKVGNDA